MDDKIDWMAARDDGGTEYETAYSRARQRAQARVGEIAAQAETEVATGDRLDQQDPMVRHMFGDS